MKIQVSTKYKLRDYLYFLIPSLLGVLLFIVPCKYNAEFNIPVGILSKIFYSAIEEYTSYIFLALTCLVSLFSLLYRKFNIFGKSKVFTDLFKVSNFWLLTRLLSNLFIITAFFKIGHESLWHSNTTVLLLHELLPILFCVFLFAGFFLPLLLDYGLLDFFGSMATKFMRPLFNLPGRSAIDCLASWVGDGTIGIIMTSKQYEAGYYSKREACVIATTFSFVSITFSIVNLSYVKLTHLTVPFFLTVFTAGIVAAIIMPRIPPLAKIDDSFMSTPSQRSQSEGDLVLRPLDIAILQAKKNIGFKTFLKNGFHNVLEMWVAVIPSVMAFGSISLILAEYTPVFKFLGYLFLPILLLFNIPEATIAAQCVVIGFADMFLPVVMSHSIESEMTKFIIAALSVTQLIYMSEVGGVLLGSKIPLKIKDLFIIFLLRTLITLPIITIAAKIIF